MQIPVKFKICIKKTYFSSSGKSLEINQLTLRVRNLDRMLQFYQEVFGLEINRKSSDPDGLETVELGFKGKFKDAVDPLLILKHDPEA